MMKIQRVSSKWAKTSVILLNPGLANYIPDTRKYSFPTLVEMLAIHATVYVKPDRGTYGSGVMRAEQRVVSLAPSILADDSDDRKAVRKEEQTMYILRYNKTAQIFASPQELHEAILGRTQGKLYLIQKGIDLLRHHERPFDLRVLAQKTPLGTWETTGMLGRVAAPHKIVTNYHNGGRILQVNTLFKEHMNPSESSTAIQQLKQLGVQIAGQLELSYPGIKEIGLDVALDQHHDMWLLEVNTLPSIIVFKLFPDKSIYRKIHRYAVAYGRLKKSGTTVSSRRKAL
ncbi:YheC/YheD family protein [Bacillus sp. FJAT-27264]|uniref:YheC/YheD family protein n=1 Tax=Paenibacillus sp. (strain DSM 101736 / FJAT-27264) TaxID=1850362 RepID=UPI0025709CFC|nr:YheC/YheD family protein [Bacillus sp. FJAT-27264]